MLPMLRFLFPFFAVVLSVFGAPAGLSAQFSDNFSDGNFTQNPSWQGELAEFIVNAAGELQLNAPDAGNSVLAVETGVPDSAVWLLDFRLEFAPSATNVLRIYLMADKADLLQANGYYLEIGENGNLDALRFYRQDGASRTLLSTGAAGLVAGDPVQVQLRITRSPSAVWSIEAAAPGGAFSAQGLATDGAYLAGPARFFGFYCLYTATRKDKFFFDNLSLQAIVPDLTPPVLLSAQAQNSTQVLATFDEPLDSVSALEIAHYTLNSGGAPTTAQFFGGGRRQVVLSLPGSLASGTYQLRTEQIADTLGNVSGLQTASFDFINVEPAVAFDVLINEIMADPSPSVGLPEAEWLELYNRSNKIINLNSLRLSDGGTPQALPDFLLHPDSFVVLATTADAALLAAVAPRVLGMAGFPSLNNDGDPLVLSTASGAVIDQVTYSLSWHTASNKKDGGWTLERINPNLPCLGAENWQSCPSLPGGTPGRINAAFQNFDDTEPPRLLTAFPESATALRLRFSEGLDQAAAASLSAYRIQPPRSLLSAVPDAADRRAVLLQLAEPLESGIVYVVTATGSLRDCSGNAAATTDTAWVGLPELPTPSDIVINELLFNPATGGSDFVELYNRSGKVFDLQGLFLANFSSNADVKAINLQRLMLPGEYLAFSANTADISTRFSGIAVERLLSMPALPSLPDDAGNITLYWSKSGQTVTIDSFDYLDDYHNALYSSSDREGVSLERIRADGPTNDPANWTSAARRGSGSGTPTQPNSQSNSPGAGSSGLIGLTPARLSPDGDGYEDFLDIQYQLPDAGYSASFTIFDASGIPVRRLVRQALIGVSGALRWDGDLDDGSLARPGIYILFVEVFAPGGDVRREKIPFAVVQRF